MVFSWILLYGSILLLVGTIAGLIVIFTMYPIAQYIDFTPPI